MHSSPTFLSLSTIAVPIKQKCISVLISSVSLFEVSQKNTVTRGTTEEALQQKATKYIKEVSDREGGWSQRKSLAESLLAPQQLKILNCLGTPGVGNVQSV